MTSRTAEGKHTKRFIILKKSEVNGDTKFVRSITLPGFYETRELAEAAIVVGRSPLPSTLYKVRQK